MDDGVVIGLVAGTIDTGGLFRELMVKRGLSLLVPLAGQVMRHPTILWGVVQTFAYPNKVEADQGDAELLFIGVSKEARRRGAGRLLAEALATECRNRGCAALTSTVDVANAGSNAFHASCGFRVIDSLNLYGREMNLYQLDLWEPQQAAES